MVSRATFGPAAYAQFGVHQAVITVVPGRSRWRCHSRAGSAYRYTMRGLDRLRVTPDAEPARHLRPASYHQAAAAPGYLQRPVDRRSLRPYLLRGGTCPARCLMPPRPRESAIGMRQTGRMPRTAACGVLTAATRRGEAPPKELQPTQSRCEAGTAGQNLSSTPRLSDAVRTSPGLAVALRASHDCMPGSVSSSAAGRDGRLASSAPAPRPGGVPRHVSSRCF